ncbi:MAG TPA: hypothetical protein VIP56_13710, partial [Nitrososphaeraceae archaeon]
INTSNNFIFYNSSTTNFKISLSIVKQELSVMKNMLEIYIAIFLVFSVLFIALKIEIELL